MPQIKVPAVYMRGGTSRAVMFHEDDLAPYSETERDAIILAAIGSPDPYGRELDGLGGGISSLSKAAIVGHAPAGSRADVTFKFAQVDESMVWTTKFPSGVVAYCSTSYKAGGIQNLRVNAQDGWFELDPAFFYDGNHGRRSDGKEIRFAPIDLFTAEMDDFARCILEVMPTRVSG